MFGEFDPNQLRQYFNEFIDKQPDFKREDRMIKEIEGSCHGWGCRIFATQRR